MQEINALLSFGFSMRTVASRYKISLPEVYRIKKCYEYELKLVNKRVDEYLHKWILAKQWHNRTVLWKDAKERAEMHATSLGHQSYDLKSFKVRYNIEDNEDEEVPTLKSSIDQHVNAQVNNKDLIDLTEEEEQELQLHAEFAKRNCEDEQADERFSEPEESITNECKKVRSNGENITESNLPLRILCNNTLKPATTEAEENLECPLETNEMLLTLRRDVSSIKVELKNLNESLHNAIAQINAKLDVLTRATKANSASNIDKPILTFTPVKTLTEAKDLEEKAMRADFFCSTIEQLGKIYETGRRLHGVTVALKLVDYIWNRDFLSKCAWSSQENARAEFYLSDFKNTISLFYRAVKYSSFSWSMEDNERFLMKYIKGSKQLKQLNQNCADTRTSINGSDQTNNTPRPSRPPSMEPAPKNSKSNDDALAKVLQEMGMYDELYEFLKSKGLTTPALIHMTSRHLDEIFGGENLSNKIIFEHKLGLWQNLRGVYLLNDKSNNAIFNKTPPLGTLPYPQAMDLMMGPEQPVVRMPSVLSIISRTKTGKELLRSYAEKNVLTPGERTALTHIIVQYLIESDFNMKSSDGKRFAAEIVSIFPTECEETYFLQHHKKAAPKGKLWDRFQNRKRALKKLWCDGNNSKKSEQSEQTDKNIYDNQETVEYYDISNDERTQDAKGLTTPALIHMTSRHLDEIFGGENLSNKIIFEHKLGLWQNLRGVYLLNDKSNNAIFNKTPPLGTLPYPQAMDLMMGPEQPVVRMPSVLSIISRTKTGKELLRSYAEKNVLTPGERTALTHIIVQYLIESDFNMKSSDGKRFAAEIVSIFPTECEETYFLQHHKKAAPKGKLWDRFQNRKRALKKLWCDGNNSKKSEQSEQTDKNIYDNQETVEYYDISNDERTQDGETSF